MGINLISLDEWKNNFKVLYYRKSVDKDEEYITDINFGDLEIEETETVTIENSKHWNSSISFTETEWKEVKGIGPTLAKRLCEGGPYDHLDSIKDIKGIKPKIYDSILEWYSEKKS
jgi:DNA uptake protein ComE-like DNA-binding protein